MDLKLRRELRRKIIHILTGVLFITSAFIFKDIDAIFWFGIILLVPFGIFYFLIRWLSHTKIGQFSYYLTERDLGHHTNGVGGLTFAGGVILSYIIFGFNPTIVIVSIVILTFGDGFASFVGMKWGTRKFKIEGHTKTLEGTIAGIVVATIVSSLFINFFVAFAVSTLTMLIELVGVRVRGREIPDNLYLPVIAGTILYIIVSFGL